jgi:hypothetical protein
MPNGYFIITSTSRGIGGLKNGIIPQGNSSHY